MFYSAVIFSSPPLIDNHHIIPFTQLNIYHLFVRLLFFFSCALCYMLSVINYLNLCQCFFHNMVEDYYSSSARIKQQA